MGEANPPSLLPQRRDLANVANTFLIERVFTMGYEFDGVVWLKAEGDAGGAGPGIIGVRPRRHELHAGRQGCRCLEATGKAFEERARKVVWLHERALSTGIVETWKKLKKIDDYHLSQDENRHRRRPARRRVRSGP